MKRKNFDKRGVKREIQKKDHMNKPSIRCFKCNKKVHYKSKCLQLKEAKKKKKLKKQQRKKTIKVTWDKSSLEESD